MVFLCRSVMTLTHSLPACLATPPTHHTSHIHTSASSSSDSSLPLLALLSSSSSSSSSSSPSESIISAAKPPRLAVATGFLPAPRFSRDPCLESDIGELVPDPDLLWALPFDLTGVPTCAQPSSSCAFLFASLAFFLFAFSFSFSFSFFFFSLSSLGC